MLFRSPRFAELAVPGKVAPFELAQDARICGPSVGRWEAVIVAHTAAEASLDDAIRVYSARVGGGGPVDLGTAGVSAARIRVGSDVWTSVRRARKPGELWLIAPAAARAAVTDAFAATVASREAFTLPEGVAARVEIHDPQARVSGAPDELAGLVSLWIEVRLTPDGGAKIMGEGRARDEGSARTAALRMNARIAAMADSFLV